MSFDGSAEFSGLPEEFSAPLLLAAVVDSSNDAIVSNRLDGTIMSWNPAAERLYGWTATEAIGQSIEMIVPEGLHEEFSMLSGRLAQGGTGRPPGDDADSQGWLRRGGLADDLTDLLLRRTGCRDFLHRARCHRPATLVAGSSAARSDRRLG
ncbi:MAG: PAS domain S-box protein [Acidimicrobiales bacterium]